VGSEVNGGRVNWGRVESGKRRVKKIENREEGKERGFTSKP
jgi:hypothetical protein